MSAPVIPALAASTVNSKWVLEVNTGTTAAPVWAPVGGLKNLAMVTDDANLEDDGRYSDGGYSRMNKTGTGWNGTATVSRAPKVTDLTAYDDAQEYLRNVAQGNLGVAAQAQIRWYEYSSSTSPRVEAYSGTAIVAYNDPGGERTANSEATFTFTGQGALLKITNPFPAAASAPIVYSVSPATGATFLVAGGTVARILGAHFTGVTAVTFGGTAATNISIWSDGEITCVSPAKTAGAQPVIVTNPTGASTAVNVTYA